MLGSEAKTLSKEVKWGASKQGMGSKEEGSKDEAP